MNEEIVDTLGQTIVPGDLIIFKGNAGGIDFDYPGIVKECSVSNHIKLCIFLPTKKRWVYDHDTGKGHYEDPKYDYYHSKQNLKGYKTRKIIRVIEEMIDYDKLDNMDFYFALKYTFEASKSLEEFTDKSLNKVCRELNKDTARLFMKM